MTAFAANFSRFMETKAFAFVNTNYAGTKIKTRNSKWIEPANEKYLAFTILPGDSFNTNIGRQKWERTPVVLHFAVYTPLETYERAAMEMAEAVGRDFANQNFAIGANHNAILRALSVMSLEDPKTGKFRVIAKTAGWHDALTS